MNITNNITKTFNNPFIALKHKNFRYYWIGMCVSLIGTWMQNIAQPWLAYTLTNSPFLLSLIGVVQFTPMLIFALFAGVFVDKFSKKKDFNCYAISFTCNYFNTCNISMDRKDTVLAHFNYVYSSWNS